MVQTYQGPPASVVLVAEVKWIHVAGNVGGGKTKFAERIGSMLGLFRELSTHSTDERNRHEERVSSFTFAAHALPCVTARS